MSLALKALQVAISQIGVEETPRGSNWGTQVKAYLNSVGINFPASWCMAFVYWCFDQARQQEGINTPRLITKTGGVIAQWNKSKSYRVTDPQPGDVFIMDFGNGLGHTGIVESVEEHLIHTVEGNTNDTGSREGYEVCRRMRTKSSIKGYLRF